MPLFFSIIIPTLNEAKFLPHLLKDLVDQSFKNFEVIVVDADSEDQTEKKALAFQKKLQLYCLHSKHRHVSVQRNLGAKKAKGTYLLFLDADIRLPHFFLEGVHYQLMKNSVDGFTTYADPDSDNPTDILFMTFQNLVHETGTRLKKPFALGACIGCEKSIFLSLHGFKPRISYMEDSEFVQRLVNEGYEFAVFNHPKFTYSLRRYRKEGSLRTIRHVLPLGLKAILTNSYDHKGTTYPMNGGAVYSDVTKNKAPGIQRLKAYVDAIIKDPKEVKSIVERLFE